MTQLLAYPNGRWLRLGLLLLLLAGGLATGPGSSARGQSADSLFEAARAEAFGAGDYERARALAYDALAQSPNYHGIRVFVARTLAWEGRRDSARTELTYVLERAPDHYEALKAIIDVESWSGRPYVALNHANAALGHYPDDAYFMEKRAGLLRWLNRPDAAVAQLNALLAADPSRESARATLRQLRYEQLKYTASLSYRQDTFRGGRTPWRFGVATLGRKTPIGSVIGRVRYANRFSSNGLQFEVDAYPSLANGLYAYVSVGASASSIFPGFRWGASLYKSLPRSFSVELGARYLNFGGSETVIYTGSLTRYHGNYLFRGTTYVTPSTSGTSLSGGVQVRRYFGGAKTYVSIKGSAGTSPSDPVFAEDVRRRSSWSVSVDGQVPLSSRTLVGGSVGYDEEELRTRTMKRVSVSASVTYEF
ncbi:MAG: YaiO family outer membrane beta-barrel protein [Salinibacter sp.]|uniref:YaiO family outer membrane beta-barrel protein n=1 Tax=Salinibacter sp. TaxID=2065818 RepID=UPI002FC2CEB8